MEREAPEGVEEEDFKKDIEKADPFENRLKPVNEDKKVKGGIPAWSVKLCGDLQNFGNENPALGTNNYGVAVLRSYVWPGCYSFFT